MPSAILVGMRNLASLLLVFSLTFAASVTSVAHAGGYTPRIACCDSATDPTSCWVTPTPADLSACDPADYVEICELDASGPISCEPVTLRCCSESSLVVWMDVCKHHDPGAVCTGVVLGEVIQ